MPDHDHETEPRPGVHLHATPCPVCGEPVRESRAMLAAGLAHPACRYPHALTASANAADPETYALRMWRARTAKAALARIVCKAVRRG